MSGDTDQLLFILDNVLGERRKHNESNKQIAYDCPVCAELKGIFDGGDGKGNLEINYETNAFNCWSCGEEHDTHGNIYKLIKQFGSHDELEHFNDLNIEFKKVNYDNDDFESYFAGRNISLPREYWPLSKDDEIIDNGYSKPYLDYLRKRGVTDELIIRFRIGYAVKGRYSKRIIIPSYDRNGNLNYYVTRHISETKKYNKYLNANGDKKQIIFNEDLIDWDKPLRLVEGPMDHLVTDNSIALLGKKMYEVLLRVIYTKNPPKVIIILDDDAYKDAKYIYHLMNTGKLKEKIFICKLHPDLDPSKFVEKFGINEWEKYINAKSYKLKENYKL